MEDHAQELGSTDAFNCLELDLVFAEVERIEHWRRNCKDIVGSIGNVKSLLNALSEVYFTTFFFFLTYLWFFLSNFHL